MRHCRVDLSSSALGDKLPGVPGPGLLHRLADCVRDRAVPAIRRLLLAACSCLLLVLLKTVEALQAGGQERRGRSTVQEETMQ